MIGPRVCAQGYLSSWWCHKWCVSTSDLHLDSFTSTLETSNWIGILPRINFQLPTSNLFVVVVLLFLNRMLRLHLWIHLAKLLKLWLWHFKWLSSFAAAIARALLRGFCPADMTHATLQKFIFAPPGRRRGKGQSKEEGKEREWETFWQS